MLNNEVKFVFSSNMKKLLELAQEKSSQYTRVGMKLGPIFMDLRPWELEMLIYVKFSFYEKAEKNRRNRPQVGFDITK